MRQAWWIKVRSRRRLKASLVPHPSDRIFRLQVRSCRRRPRRPPLVSPLAPLFTEVSQYHHLARAALIERVRTLLARKGLYAVDGFSLFDSDGDGVLSCAELAAGLSWLGLR